jgi:hypothetical protein
MSFSAVSVQLIRTCAGGQRASRNAPLAGFRLSGAPSYWPRTARQDAVSRSWVMSTTTHVSPLSGVPTRLPGQAKVSLCVVGVVKLRRRCDGFRSLRSVTVMGGPLPSAWTGSWTGALDNPSAVSAVNAMACVICAASALGARGRTSCKRQASGSNPLTGSQIRGH